MSNQSIAVDLSNPFMGPHNPFVGRTVSPFGDPTPKAVKPTVSADAPEGTYEYALRQCGAAVPHDEIEETAAAVDLRIYWGRNLLGYSHLAPVRPYYVGEEESKNLGCDYFIPAEKLGTTRAPLVLTTESGTMAVLLAGATGTIELPGDRSLSIAEAITNGLAQPCIELSGAHQIALPDGASVHMELGDMVFEIAAVKAAKRLPAVAAAALATGTLIYLALSFAGHVGLLVAMAMFSPPLGDTTNDALTEDQVFFIKQHLASLAEQELEAKPSEELAEVGADNREGGTGVRAKLEEGSMGLPSSKLVGNRWAVKGDPANPNPHVAKEAALREAANFGMIGLLNSGVGGDPNAPTAPWGFETADGIDALSARGNMWGNMPGESYGVGGLGLSGVGEGGGGYGEGLGLGTVGTIGHGSGRGIGDGFGDGTGRIGRGRRPKPPTLRIAQVSVSGRIPPEVIQRIVRQNFGRFRVCYESGLRNNPSLQGRVVVRFTIGRDGRVSNVGGAGDLPDSGVVSCVTRAFYGLSFPRPDGGIVMVSYPIVFTPGG